MQRLLTQSAAALAALVITISTLTAAVGVPGPQVAALISVPALA